MSSEIVTEIRELRREGYPFQEIADRLGISKKMAWKYGRNVKMRDDKRYQRQRTEGVGAVRKNEDDERKIGTWRDIPHYNEVKNTPKGMKANDDERERLRRLRERRAEEAERERSKRWRENERIHKEGREKQIEAGTEVARCVESLMTRKTPGGHVAKGFSKGMDVLGTKRELFERDGDVRLFGENTRILLGDQDSLFGFGIIRIGKEGMLGQIRKRILKNE